MKIWLAIPLVLVIVLGGCSVLPGGGDATSEGPRTSRRPSASRPSTWTIAKVSYFSTQTGGMLQKQRSKLPLEGPFGTVQGPSYFALVNKAWTWRDRRQAVQENARVLAYTTRKNLNLDEPFELVKKPNIKQVDDEVIAKLLEQLEELGFFDMPPARDLALREDGRGGYILPTGRAWLMVQLDDWRRTVALDDLRTEQIAAFTQMKNAVAGTFTAIVSPTTSVVVEPIDLRAMANLHPGYVKEPIPDAELREDGQARYPNARKAEPNWWKKKLDKKDDLEDFFGKRGR